MQFFGPGSSLDKLAKNLTDFPILKEMFPQVWDLRPEEGVPVSERSVPLFIYEQFK